MSPRANFTRGLPVTIVAAALVLASTASTAHAQAKDAARRHYHAGQRAYDAGDYDAALSDFRRALDLSGRPGLWFNIGQAHRLSGDCPRALAAYRQYTALDTAAARRTNVGDRIEEMRDCVRRDARRSQRRLAALQATPPPSRREALGRSSKLPVDDGSSLRWLSAGIASSGLVSLGASIYLGVRARDRARALTERYARGGTWSADSAEREERIASDKLGAALLAGAGGLAITGAIYLYLRGRARAEYADYFAVRPHRRGAELVWSWSL